MTGENIGPSAEEIRKAEEQLSERQREMSEIRAESYNAGKEAAKNEPIEVTVKGPVEIKKESVFDYDTSDIEGEPFGD